jgi:ATP/ADP translocase
MDKNNLRSLRPVFILFIIVTAFCITGKSWLEKKGISQEVLLGGNLLLVLVSVVAYLLMRKAVKSNNPQAFVRAIYGSFMLRFFLVAIVAFIYIMVAKSGVNKPALIACAGLYIIYTGIETRSLMKLLKQNKHA